MEFEWDDQKSIINNFKHGFNFDQVTEVFDDDQAVMFLDDRKDYRETREAIIRKIKGVLIILVIYTERNHRIRIISARRANKKEKQVYYGYR
jgi:uncharacterized DUF497 family protein